MVNELKKIIGKTPVTTYLCCVRRTVTQYETIDVEIVTDKFDIDKPNENYFIYGVQLSAIISLYGGSSLINRPKENVYVLITQTDNGTWWVIKDDKVEVFTLSASDIIINISSNFEIRNVDVIRFKKLFRMGVFDNTYDEVSIVNEKIVLEILNKSYIQLSNNGLQLNGRLDISHQKYIQTSGKSYMYMIMNQWRQLYLQNLIAQCYLELGRDASITSFTDKLLLPYIVWFLEKHKDERFEVSKTFITEWFNYVDPTDINDVFNRLLASNQTMYNFLYTSYSIPKTQLNALVNDSKGIAYSYDGFGSNFPTDNPNKTSKLVYSVKQYEKRLQTWSQHNNTIFAPIPLRKAMNGDKTIMQGDVSEDVYNKIRDNINLTTAEMFMSKLRGNYLFGPTKVVNIGNGSNGIIETIILNMEALTMTTSWVVANESKQQNINIRSLGEILNDMTNTLQGYIVDVTNASTGVTAPGIVVTGYYDTIKLELKHILKIDKL